jgi:hypothetical protein
VYERRGSINPIGSRLSINERPSIVGRRASIVPPGMTQATETIQQEVRISSASRVIYLQFII